MNPRLRRLLADSETLRTEFAGHPHIHVEPLGWDPPEQYRVTYAVPGVALDAQGQPIVVSEHRVLVTLGSGYPRQKPYFTVETQVFHPNFGPNAGDEVCIGDYWTPQQTLADIIVKIGEMLEYREFNVHSPLNAIAGRWAAENTAIFPIGDISLFRAEPDVQLGSEAQVAERPRLELVIDLTDEDAAADGLAADEAVSDDEDGQTDEVSEAGVGDGGPDDPGEDHARGLTA